MSIALQTCFANAGHLPCWVHAKASCKKKLVDLAVKFIEDYMKPFNALCLLKGHRYLNKPEQTCCFQVQVCLIM